MNRVLCGFAVLCGTVVYGQQAGKQVSSSPKAVAAAKPESAGPSVAQLEKHMAELEKQLKDLKESHESLQNYVFTEISNLEHPTATFDPSSPGPYQLIDSSIGPLLVSLGKLNHTWMATIFSLKLGT